MVSRVWRTIRSSVPRRTAMRPPVSSLGIQVDSWIRVWDRFTWTSSERVANHFANRRRRRFASAQELDRELRGERAHEQGLARVSGPALPRTGGAHATHGGGGAGGSGGDGARLLPARAPGGGRGSDALAALGWTADPEGTPISAKIRIGSSGSEQAGRR